MKDLELIRYASERYRSLQGLRLLPFAALLLLFSLSEMGWMWPGFAVWHPISTGLAFLLAWGASVWIGRYYERTFGMAEPLKRTATWVVAIAVIAFIFITTSFWIAVRGLNLPFDLVGVVSALALFGYWWYANRLDWHYIALGALLVLISFLPVFGLAPCMATHTRRTHCCRRSICYSFP